MEVVERLLGLPGHTRSTVEIAVVFLGGAAQALFMFSDLGSNENLLIRLAFVAGLCFLAGLGLGVLKRMSWVLACGLASWGSIMWAVVALRNGFVGVALALVFGSLTGLFAGGAVGATVRRAHSQQKK